ncbi:MULTISPECIES: acyltransferase domain-containing protein [Anaerolinea]|uniref:acyltransferase domain-containing protein n=1 Tax=Anaerolinea TaxID=233189 RepID=UPI002628AC71|nr:acyltransferase domain-containing protein [Anaerolinea thermophila]
MKEINDPLSEQDWWNAPERLAWWNFLGFSEGAIHALESMAESICNSRQLMEAFNAFHQKTAHQGDWHFDWTPLPFDPLIQEQLGEDTSLFYLLAYLSALPHTLQAYRRRGIPMETFAETMADIQFYVEWYAQRHHRWGFEHFPWIARHLSGRLFSLGRLQFMLLPFPGKVTALRHRHDHRIILLADPRQPLRADGYAAGAGTSNTLISPEEVWHPEWEEDTRGWKGHPVSPQGYVLKRSAYFSREEWEIALQHGDCVLDVHIPQGKSLTPEDCQRSLERAYEFFPTYFPEQTFRGVYCHTWMFTPQLGHLLPPESRILQFQREFYLYPHPGNEGFLLEFVFGRRERPENNAPRDTSLQRAVLDWLDRGGELFDLPGVYLYPPSAWGKQSHWRDWGTFALEE